MDYWSFDKQYMYQALHEAKKAFDQGEVPVGAVVVSPAGSVLGVGHNRTEMYGCQDQHAEMCAIRDACKKLNNWRLDGCTIYVTLEPCVMCIGCIVLSRCERLVYATESPEFGYHFGRENICELYAKTVKNVTVGVCRDDSEELLRFFFKKRRTMYLK